VIESDEGYSVEVLGRTGLLHSEGEKHMHNDSEVLNAGSIAVYKNSKVAHKYYLHIYYTYYVDDVEERYFRCKSDYIP
jgi:hypothetical protein